MKSTDQKRSGVEGPPRLSIVVPLYDEAENVDPLTRQVLAAVGEFAGGMELVLVDDCSRDPTWERIQAQAAKDPRVRGVRHLRNQGQSAALWTGFKQSVGAIIATLDGDLQNDPGDLPLLIRELDSCDLACGVRARRADNFTRRISSRVARWARRVALRSSFLDTGCNLRAFRREVLETIPAFDGLHRFMPVLAQNAGARVRELPVRHHPRTAGVSKYGVWNRLGRGIRDLVMVGLFLRRQIRVMEPGAGSESAGCRPTR